MKVKMTLESDAIFGNGVRVPGGEDISVCADDFGFPYYKASTFKGIFRKELKNLLGYKKVPGKEEIIGRLLGKAGNNLREEQGTLLFSDFTLSPYVKSAVLQETTDKRAVLSAVSYLRAFTQITEGTAKEGSLRYCRCIKKGLTFLSSIQCQSEDEELVREAMGLVKWIGTMRNRGFGKVRIEEVEN